MSTLLLLSPLSGQAIPLSDSPDPAFAAGMIGAGLAIDPDIGELRAPCAGVIAATHASGHALTVRSDNGADVLIHLGVDTVNLRGTGFTAHVREGQRVAAGDKLVSFDIAAIRPKVSSMVSMIVVANGDAFGVAQLVTNGKVNFGDPLLNVLPNGQAAVVKAVDGGISTAATFTVLLRLAYGLHARPAAQLAHAARLHAGPVTVTANGRTANAKSVVALVALGTRFNDKLDIRVEGEGADAVADSLFDLILAGLGDPIAEGPAAAPEPAAPIPGALTTTNEEPFHPHASAVIRGRSAVAGIAVGLVVRHDRGVLDLPRDGRGASVERARLGAAVALVAERLQETGVGAHTSIAAAHREILADPDLLEAAETEIVAGRSAEWAWHTACTAQANLLASLADARLAERASDMHDIAAQGLSALSGHQSGNALAALPVGSVVLADEVLPSETAGLTAGHLAALLLRNGGPTSHAAIIAAGLGIPTIVALGPQADRIPAGAQVIVDASLGSVTVYPSDIELAAARDRIAARDGRKALQRAAATRDCQLADGVRIEVFANLGRVGEGAMAVAEGAEGCGLLRSEFLFLDRDAPPSEDEQYAEYQAIADELAGRPLVIRTLDVGGDKPLAYLPLPKEENPFLGLRGVRVGLAQPALLRAQIRAILRVKPYGVVRIMVPMVASVAEMVAVRTMVDEERQQLGRAEPIQIGAMIEIPAAAVAARQLSQVCDFFSVGTNDLTQYALAMDRGNPAVAAGVDALHPGVLGLIRLACEGAKSQGRIVAVCGGAASDPIAAPILVGLGVTELSAAPAAIPEIKNTLAGLSLDQCKLLADQALAACGPDDVRALKISAPTN